MNRRQLIARLIGSSDRAAALRVARENRARLDVSVARDLLERFNRTILADPSGADAIARAASAVAAIERGVPTRAIAHRIAGVLAHVRGRRRTATLRLTRAAELLAEAGLLLEAGDVWRALIDVQIHAEDDAAARRAARRARDCYTAAGGADPRRRGSLEMNLGNLHHRRDEHDAALRAYARARRHFQRAGEPRRLANLDYNRANILTALDRTGEARTLYRSARDTFQREKLPALVGQSDFALAAIDMLEGRLDDAVEMFSRSRELHVEQRDAFRVAHADLDIAEAYLRLNRPDDAERSAQRAERYFRTSGERAESAMCAGVLGGAALQKGRPGQAARWFARGRAIQHRLRNPVATAGLEVGQAQAELHAGRTDRARRLAARAARVLGQRGRASLQARALAVGAEAALAGGKPALARRWGRRSRDIARRGRDRRVQLAALLGLAREAEQRGAGEEAYRHLRAAERCVEALRRGVTTEESQLAFALDKSEVYEALVLNRLNRGDSRSIRAALEFAERGKARVLAERLAEGKVDLLGGKASPRSRRLLERLHAIEGQLALAETRLQEDARPRGLRSATLTRLEKLTRERLRTLERLSAGDPERAALAGAVPPDPARAMARLADDETVLEYTQAGGKIHLFVIERDRVEAHTGVARADEIRDLVELLQLQLGKATVGGRHALRFDPWIRDTLRRYLEQLYRLLLGPVHDRLEGRRVRVVPHGPLHGLPFHALERQGVALIERCEVSYAPSLNTMGLLRADAAPPNDAPLVLGISDRAAPLIDREVDAVRRRLGRRARVLRGALATREALHEHTEQSPLLHVACHGYYNENGPWSSGLRLGDAWFSLADLYGMRGTARLVVLSGCETGRGTVYSGDEWVGLIRGFLQAGARAVVASLWEVHDEATLQLMDAFYRELAGGATVGAALARAQRAARKRNPMPLVWAPFVVVGDPELRLRVREEVA